MKISENQEKVLKFLAPYWNSEMNCYFFRGIAKETGLDVRIVRLACRALARKGLAEYCRGLFDEDGMIAGSGYCATRDGALLVLACKVCKKEISDMTDGTCYECFKKAEKTKGQSSPQRLT